MAQNINDLFGTPKTSKPTNKVVKKVSSGDPILDLLRTAENESFRKFPTGNFDVVLSSIDLKESKTNKLMMAVTYKDINSNQVWFENFMLSGVEESILKWNLGRLKKVVLGFGLDLDGAETLAEFAENSKACYNDKVVTIDVSYKLDSDFPTIKIIG